MNLHFCLTLLMPLFLLPVFQYIGPQLDLLKQGSYPYFGLDSESIEASGLLRYSKDLYYIFFSLVWPMLVLSTRRRRIHELTFLFLRYEALLISCGTLGHIVDVDIMVFVAGLRALLLLHTCFGVYVILSMLEFHSQLIRIIRGIIIFISAFSVGFALLQWASLGFASIINLRLFSVYQNSGVFGQALLALAMYTFVDRPLAKRHWLFFVLLLGSIITGSRMAMTSVGFLWILSYFLGTLESKHYSMRSLVPLIMILCPFGLLILGGTMYASDELSGRGAMLDNTDIKEGRLGLLFYTLEQLANDNLVWLWCGRGLGYGTNALFTLPGELGGKTPFSVILDNTFATQLMQTGLLGLILLLLVFMQFITSAIQKTVKPVSKLIIGIIGLVMFFPLMQQNIFESYVFLPQLTLMWFMIFHEKSGQPS